MAATFPVTSLTTERIRSAAKHLEQDARRVQSDLNGQTLVFKIVADEMEREHDSEAVNALRQGLLDVLNCAHRLEYQCSALQLVSQSFEARAEQTSGRIHALLSADPFDPAKDKLCQQLDRAVWNIRHAGEAAPGQEEDEFVMINNQGVRNINCPLTGRPVISLETPVQSRECHHIYDLAAVMEYIAKSGRRRCKCAIAGCPIDLKKDNIRCDLALSLEIQELRLRERAAKRVDYADLEDET